MYYTQTHTHFSFLSSFTGGRNIGVFGHLTRILHVTGSVQRIPLCCNMMRSFCSMSDWWQTLTRWTNIATFTL